MANYFLETQSHEWILSARNGAYALGTGNLINQRKYNGLLVKSDINFERVLLVSGIEEAVEWRGESFHLDSSHYSNCIFPEGFLHLVKSWLRPYPIFLYSAVPHNDDILIKKEIMMDEETSTVLIKYTNLSSHKLHFRLRPKFAMRNHHHLNEEGTWNRAGVHSEFNERSDLANIVFCVQRIDNMISAYGWLQHGYAYYDTKVYGNVYFPWEASRGYPSTEDLIAPLGFEFDLKPNETNYLLFSDKYVDQSLMKVEDIEKRFRKLPFPKDVPNVRHLASGNYSVVGVSASSQKGIGKKQEIEEEKSILSSIDFDDDIMFEFDDYMKILEFSMQDFLANNDVIAGFPWFGAWGRDTMIALDGVMRLPKGAEIAYEILEKYSSQIIDGLIPNMCSESHQEANYISIDATLWFLLRIYEVCKALNNDSKTKKAKTERWKKAVKLTEEVLENLIGKRHDEFFLREDGLLELREGFASATWMDAKVSNKAVTPRDGAPVEINALLFNALCAYESMIDEHNEDCAKKDTLLVNQTYMEAMSCILSSFDKFWIGDYLADRLIGNTPVKEYRPNALIATSLPFSDRLLPLVKLQQVYETAHVDLFTPYGIRTLCPQSPMFKKKYFGGVVERDKAYHQGTVWAWLLLPFVKTWIKAFPDKSVDEANKHISYLIERLRNGYMRGHIASVAEVWDGDKPHFPKGCPAQAWSVSAIYCIEKILIEMQGRLQ